MDGNPAGASACNHLCKSLRRDAIFGSSRYYLHQTYSKVAAIRDRTGGVAPPNRSERPRAKGHPWVGSSKAERSCKAAPGSKTSTRARAPPRAALLALRRPLVHTRGRARTPRAPPLPVGHSPLRPTASPARRSPARGARRPARPRSPPRRRARTPPRPRVRASLRSCSRDRRRAGARTRAAAR